MSVKITKVTLYRTRLGNNNVVLDSSAHQTMLTEAPKVEVENCTFQRDTRIFRAPLSMDVAGRYNYISYTNNGMDFYGFITQMTYVNDNMTAVYWEPDYWSTWEGYLETNRPCFVERQIIAKSDDSIGKYVQPEPVSFDDYRLLNGNVKAIIYGDNYNWNVRFIYGRKNLEEDLEGKIEGNYYEGFNIADFPIEHGPVDINGFVDTFDLLVEEDPFTAVYMIPDLSETMLPDENGVFSALDQEFEITMPIDVKNNKCYTFPYCRVTFTSSNGETKQPNPEDVYVVSTATPDKPSILYNIKAVLEPRIKMMMYPCLYEGISNETVKQDAVILDCFPDCALGLISSDSAFAIGKSLASVGSNLFNVNIPRAVTTGLNYLQNIATPSSVTAYDSSTPLLLNTNSIGFFIMFETLRSDEMQAVDDYFTRYGYAINKIEYVDYHLRSKWDYVKTKDCQFPVRYAPIEAEQAIDKMFDDGITIWHDYDTFGDYSQDNS